jgi:hypothetical protein
MHSPHAKDLVTSMDVHMHVRTEAYALCARLCAIQNPSESSLTSSKFTIHTQHNIAALAFKVELVVNKYLFDNMFIEWYVHVQGSRLQRLSLVGISMKARPLSTFPIW